MKVQADRRRVNPIAMVVAAVVVSACTYVCACVWFGGGHGGEVGRQPDETRVEPIPRGQQQPNGTGTHLCKLRLGQLLCCPCLHDLRLEG